MELVNRIDTKLEGVTADTKDHSEMTSEAEDTTEMLENIKQEDPLNIDIDFVKKEEYFADEEAAAESVPQVQKQEKPLKQRKKRGQRRPARMKHLCDRCDYVADTQSKLRIHKKSEHISDSYYCDQCGFVAKTNFSFLHHKRAHSSLNFSCDKCQYRGRSLAYLNNHISKSHSNVIKVVEPMPGRYSCDLCAVTCSRYGQLILHKRTHMGWKYPCDQDKRKHNRILDRRPSKTSTVPQNELEEINQEDENLEGLNVNNREDNQIEANNSEQVGIDLVRNKKDFSNFHEESDSVVMSKVMKGNPDHNDARNADQVSFSESYNRTNVYANLSEYCFNMDDRRTAIMLILVQKRGNIATRTVAELTGTSTNTVLRLRRRFEVDGEDLGSILKRSSNCLTEEGQCQAAEITNRTDSLNLVKTTAKPQVKQNNHDEDLRYQYYLKRRDEPLTEALKAQRVERAKRLQAKLKSMEPNTQWFFADQKSFYKDHKEDQWLACPPNRTPKGMKDTPVEHVMIFGVISSDGFVMPPHLFEPGMLQLNGEIYTEVMTTVVLPWIRYVAGDQPWVWLQDFDCGQPPEKTAAFLESNCQDFVPPDMLPPNSPDLNPMDYFTWGNIERTLNQSVIANQAGLKSAVRSAFAKLKCNLVRNACARFKARLKVVIASNGQFLT